MEKYFFKFLADIQLPLRGTSANDPLSNIKEYNLNAKQ